MAIAASPPVALPPGDRGAGSRKVAMSLRDERPASRGETENGGQLGLDRLTSIALRLAARASTWPGMARPTERRWELMAVTDAFEAWVIAWPPGGAIELHDHGDSSGAVLVVTGELRETTIVPRASGGVVLETTTAGVGQSIGFEGRHIHDVVNVGEVPAISVHVYAPRLTTMRYYRVIEGVLHEGPAVRYSFGEAVA
jgi:Cysteine dioxygenase type I